MIGAPQELPNLYFILRSPIVVPDAPVVLIAVMIFYDLRDAERLYSASNTTISVYQGPQMESSFISSRTPST